jgi:hypothetical protein
VEVSIKNVISFIVRDLLIITPNLPSNGYSWVGFSFIYFGAIFSSKA